MTTTLMLAILGTAAIVLVPLLLPSPRRRYRASVG